MAKLVRDKIPEIIRAQGKEACVQVLDDEQFRVSLQCKLKEEVEELIDATTRNAKIAEAADVMEVFLTLIHQEGIDINEVHAARVRKAREKGTFDERYFLYS